VTHVASSWSAPIRRPPEHANAAATFRQRNVPVAQLERAARSSSGGRDILRRSRRRSRRNDWPARSVKARCIAWRAIFNENISIRPRRRTPRPASATRVEVQAGTSRAAGFIACRASWLLPHLGQRWGLKPPRTKASIGVAGADSNPSRHLTSSRALTRGRAWPARQVLTWNF
jgi:hypothetical protein